MASGIACDHQRHRLGTWMPWEKCYLQRSMYDIELKLVDYLAQTESMLRPKGDVMRG